MVLLWLWLFICICAISQTCYWSFLRNYAGFYMLFYLWCIHWSLSFHFIVIGTAKSSFRWPSVAISGWDFPTQSFSIFTKQGCHNKQIGVLARNVTLVSCISDQWQYHAISLNSGIVDCYYSYYCYHQLVSCFCPCVHPCVHPDRYLSNHQEECIHLGQDDILWHEIDACFFKNVNIWNFTKLGLFWCQICRHIIPLSLNNWIVL